MVLLIIKYFIVIWFISVGHLYSSISSHTRSHTTATLYVKHHIPHLTPGLIYMQVRQTVPWEVCIIWDVLQSGWSLLCEGGFRGELWSTLQPKSRSLWAIRVEPSWPVTQGCHSGLACQGADLKFIYMFLLRDGVFLLKPLSYYFPLPFTTPAYLNFNWESPPMSNRKLPRVCVRAGIFDPSVSSPTSNLAPSLYLHLP